MNIKNKLTLLEKQEERIRQEVIKLAKVYPEKDLFAYEKFDKLMVKLSSISESKIELENELLTGIKK